jgi:predicted Zn-dependent protease
VTVKRTSRIARVALVALALVVIAWLAVGLRSAVPETRAKDALAHTPVSNADRADALRLLHDARTLNPDTRPRVTEGALLVASKRPHAAAAVLRGVVAEEPQNAQAWALLTAAYRRDGDPRARAAFARFQALKPPVGR